MPDLMTARDVESKRFSKAMRGYSATEVDHFLDQVAEDVQKYCVQYADLERYAARLEDKIREYESMKETLSGTLLMAQKTADAKEDASNRQAEAIISEAKFKAEQILQEADALKERERKELTHLRQLKQEFKANFCALLSRFSSLVENEDEETEENDAAESMEEDVSK